MSRNGNIESEIAIRLNYYLFGRTHICFFAIVNATYVTQCYDIKSMIVK